MSLKRSLVRKRSGGEKEIYRGLCCGLRAALSGTILRQSTLVLLGVTVRSLTAPNEEESTLTPRVAFITISQMQSVPGN